MIVVTTRIIYCSMQMLSILLVMRKPIHLDLAAAVTISAVAAVITCVVAAAVDVACVAVTGCGCFIFH